MKARLMAGFFISLPLPKLLTNQGWAKLKNKSGQLITTAHLLLSVIQPKL
jgi:hypothetical protein